jgi:hypothetical protein
LGRLRGLAGGTPAREDRRVSARLLAVSKVRTCIFCGRTPLTKEHVVGDWARRFADSDQRPILQLCDREGEARDEREWTARAYDRQARVVCASCNNGWMSDLETQVSLLLAPDTLDGRPLCHDEQTLLATWAMKTALVLNAAETPDRRVIPSEVARRFGRDQQIPEHTEIWITSYTGSDDQLPAFAGLGIDLDNRQDSHRGWRDLAVTTFLVGPFVFQVFFARPELGTMSLTRVFPPNTHIPRLWPIAELVTWRLSPGLGRDGVIAFAEQITASLWRSKLETELVG